MLITSHFRQLFQKGCLPSVGLMFVCLEGTLTIDWREQNNIKILLDQNKFTHTHAHVANVITGKYLDTEDSRQDLIGQSNSLVR